MSYLRRHFALVSVCVLSLYACGSSKSDGGLAAGGAAGQGATGEQSSTPGGVSGSGGITCAALEACICDGAPTTDVCQTLQTIVQSTTNQYGAAQAEAYCSTLPVIQPDLYGSCDFGDAGGAAGTTDGLSGANGSGDAMSGGTGGAGGIREVGGAGVGGSLGVAGRGGDSSGSLDQSCVGLAKTCGPNGNDNCCASTLVSGGTFYRGDDGVTHTDMSSPATVSDFRLDTYEITVGRFRNFVAGYTRDLISAGAGANPNNPEDTGWDIAWNANLDTDSKSLGVALKCQATDQTWTDMVGDSAAESLPINCLNWYEAEAFCIWDGGRLPTEAEWDYAASGGAEQRLYPWGSAEPDCDHANFLLSGGCVGATNRVGSESPTGDGKWGQADLAGNVFEWVQDWYVSPYPAPCDNCSSLATAQYKVPLGGSFRNGPAYLATSYRYYGGDPLVNQDNKGARCARNSAP
jgi:sulfatase modifying factor 1